MNEIDRERAIGRLEGQLSEISQSLRAAALADAQFRQQVLSGLEEMRGLIRTAADDIRELKDWRLSVDPIIQAHATWIENANRSTMVMSAKSGGIAGILVTAIVTGGEIVAKKLGLGG